MLGKLRASIAPVVLPGAVADLRGLAPGAHLREPRVALGRDAPALVVGEVPMEAVQLEEGLKSC